MGQFDWRRMREYWEEHDRRWTPTLDRDADPYGLANVCFVGAPRQVNRRHAAEQERTFRELLSTADFDRHKRALDVGCGGGRWSSLLADLGFEVTGIDLQSNLLKYAAERDHRVNFVHTDIQSFSSERSFDLIVSVTVLQHLPDSEQAVAIAKIRELLSPGGYVLVLENTRDRGSHVFARPASRWVSLFGEQGFQTIKIRPYSPVLATGVLGALRKAASATIRKSPPDSPQAQVSRFSQEGPGHTVLSIALRAASALDAGLASLLPARLLPYSHVGLLFRAT